MPLRKRWGFLLVAPAAVLIIIFFVVPVVAILLRSFTEPALGFETYQKIMGESSTWAVLFRTLWMGVLAVLVCLAFGYPYAYLMTIVSPAMQAILMTIVMVPFWTSLMARTFAWISLLQRDGPVSSLLGLFGMPDVVLLGTATGVLIGIVQILMPYMVLVLYSSMAGIDRGLLTTAQSLGATRYQAFRQVFFPLSVPGVAAGGALVFILTLGFYITPQLLGSPRESLIAQTIGVRVERIVDFAGAGALSVILLVSAALLLGVAAAAIAPFIRRATGQLGKVRG